MKDLHFYAFLIIKLYVAQVLHGQVYLIPKDLYVSVIVPLTSHYQNNNIEYCKTRPYTVN